MHNTSTLTYFGRKCIHCRNQERNVNSRKCIHCYPVYKLNSYRGKPTVVVSVRVSLEDKKLVKEFAKGLKLARMLAE